MARLKAIRPRLGTLAPRIGRAAGDEASRNRQRVDLEPWRRWYRTKRWADLRMRVFVRDLFKCRMCGRLEGNTSLLVCDHKQPHHGDETLFWDEGNLQTLCKPCHDGEKQRIEKGRRT